MTILLDLCLTIPPKKVNGHSNREWNPLEN